VVYRPLSFNEAIFGPTDEDIKDQQEVIVSEISDLIEQFNKLNEQFMENARELARRDAL
jgi:hypothetical protein